MRLRRKLLTLGVAVGLTGAMLATATSAVGADHFGPGGRLDLVVTAAGGDAFEFTPTGAPGPTETENFISDNKAKLTELNTPSDLVMWDSEGQPQGQLPYVGLKANQWGVRAKGEGAGEPAAQVNFSQDSGVGQALIVQINDRIAWQAQLALKFKFGASVLIEALDASGSVAKYTGPGTNPQGDPFIAGDDITATASCVGGPDSDCGADSGNDRLNVTIGVGTEVSMFTGLRITVSAPSDGAVALVDDYAAGYDTYIDIAPFDGVLACGGTATAQDGTAVEGQAAAATFLRIQTSDLAIADGCEEPPKPYVLALNEEDIPVDFAPEAPLIPAAYRFDINIVDDFANPIDDADLEYDPDGDGPLPRRLVPVCNIRLKATGDSEAFGEFGLVTSTGAPGFPTLDGLAADETACLVAYDHVVTRGYNHWVGYLEDDPHFF
jgi:hypothetical protein